MRRRTFTLGAFFAAIVGAPRKLFAKGLPRGEYAIQLGRHKYDSQWREVSLDTPSWRTATISEFFKFRLKRGRSEQEDIWLDVKDEDYANLDLAQRQEYYRDNWLRERGYTAQTLDMKMTIAFERAWGSRNSDGAMDPDMVEDKDRLVALQQEARRQARENVLPHTAEGKNA
ncbi:MAG TPA: hypothetical protein VK777_28450 [Reyranella sp.]|jgi:hypothetical protein|nr:hypothetical protein [Reyranella sp.]